ncbi:MAG: type III pantothenate kinase [Candidatus Omnitrophica bacterium]|nr:type III pantothenate kinase [Candidatus Omnitrophota bacterium]MDD5042368.1 type III pantothenate kinase [Candidatus Omnitrophota bacterium]MDD5500656.1 type III pantothenate kinase [Candidatus Omnitrophota bacterium]
MLLAVDIGNTNISCGLFGKNRRAASFFDIPLAPGFGPSLDKKLKTLPPVSSCMACSVAPKSAKTVFRLVSRATGVKPLLIGSDIAVPLKSLYRKGSNLGQDRLVNAYAASLLYRPPLIVIDAGTAITLDIVSSKNEYLGGMILPGVRMSLSSLKNGTAMLPDAVLSRPRSLIGRDTEGCMLSGTVLGAADACGGLIRRIKKETGNRTRVIGTGGGMALIKKYFPCPVSIIEELTLKGINFIHEYYGKNRS